MFGIWISNVRRIILIKHFCFSKKTTSFLPQNLIISNEGKAISWSRKSRENRGHNAEIARKLCRKFHYRIKKSSTKFLIEERKPHFKLRKALFKRGLDRTCKNKNILEFDVEKDGGIIFQKKMILLKITRKMWQIRIFDICKYAEVCPELFSTGADSIFMGKGQKHFPYFCPWDIKGRSWDFFFIRGAY